jgi:hypothetical protein
MPLALRPGYRLRLGLERLQDAIAFLLDDKVLDWGYLPAGLSDELQ